MIDNLPLRPGDRVEATEDIREFHYPPGHYVPVAPKGSKGTVTKWLYAWSATVSWDHRPNSKLGSVDALRSLRLLCPRDYAFQRARFGKTDTCQTCPNLESCLSGRPT